MPVTAFHQLTATTPDDLAYEIRPSHNNQSHLVTLNVLATEISQLFSNKNGVSFGLDGTNITATVATNYQSQGAYLTTAMQSNAATISNINVSAGTTSNNLSAFTFGDSNGVSFGLSGSVITATVATNYQSQGAYLTTARASNDAIGLNTALTANGVSVTANSSGLSLNFPAFLTTGALSNHSHGVSFTSGSTVFQTLSFTNSNGISFNSSTQGIFGSHNGITTGRASNDAVGLNTALTGNGVAWTVNSGGISLNVPAFLTTAALSDHSHGNPTLALTNLTGTTASNSAGFTLSLSAAAPGAAVEANWIHALGANTAGNTTVSGSTLGFSGINLTLSGTNNSQLVISAHATSSIVGTGGITVSTAGSTISVSLLPVAFFEPRFPHGTGSTTFLQPVGQWWLQPFNPPFPLSGGRLNVMTQFGSTSQLPRGTTSASYGTATSGPKNMRYQYSLSAALFSLGAGTNSTRLESFWSNQHSFEISHVQSISQAGGASISVSNGITLSGISNINSAGGVTTTTYGGSSTVSTASAAMASIAASSMLSFVNNMLSDSLQLPIPFNTTINGGHFFLGLAWSTASTTSGSSQVGFAVVNAVGNMLQTNVTGYRMFGRTTTNVSSQIFPGLGAFASSSAAPPATIAHTDIRTLATNAVHYVNYVNSADITI